MEIQWLTFKRQDYIQLVQKSIEEVKNTYKIVSIQQDRVKLDNINNTEIHTSDVVRNDTFDYLRRNNKIQLKIRKKENSRHEKTARNVKIRTQYYR